MTICQRKVYSSTEKHAKKKFLESNDNLTLLVIKNCLTRDDEQVWYLDSGAIKQHDFTKGMV